MDLFTAIDYIGTMVFAISGTLTAAQKKLDWFGAMFIGFVTAIGGGTVRDLLMGNLPVTWIQSYNYFFLILGGFLITILFKKVVLRLRNTLFLFDTIGIGVFTVLGLEKALAFGITPPVAVILGVSSAVVGGVIRDTLCNELPLIFHREVYATACIAGAIIYLGLFYLGLPKALYTNIAVASIITIRLLAVRFNITMPTISLGDEKGE